MKAYGAVSVLVQLATERVGFHPVSREVFRPRPNVDSALVAFRRVELPRNYALVKRALDVVSAETNDYWRAKLEKRIPVSAGLGGGSSDAATALALAGEGVTHERLRDLAGAIGADVPFFLESGPQLGTGTGTDLEPLSLPQDYWIVVIVPKGTDKTSTAD